MDLLIQNLKQALRDLRRHGWQAAVSAVGLAVGIVSLTFSLNWLWTETNYDYFRPGYKDLYLMLGDDTVWVSPFISYNVAGQLDSLLAGQAEVGIKRGAGQQCKIYADSLQEDYFYGLALPVMPGMVSTLGLQALGGRPEEALAKPGHVVLTERLARRIFGRTDVVGRSFKTSGWYIDGMQTVGAVVADNAGETNVEFDLLVPLEVQDYEQAWDDTRNFMVCIRTDAPDAVEEAFRRIYLVPEKQHWTFRLTPLRTAQKMAMGDTFLQAYFYPLAFTAIALLLWWSAMVNLLAVYTSVFLGRTREYALRRSLGATSGQNACWMCVAVFPVVLVAVLLSAMVMEWGLYGGNVPGNPVHVYRVFFPLVAATFLLVGVGMTYPVWRMRRVYRRMLSGCADGGHSHAWLLVVQCGACVFLLFVALGMQRQIAGMLHSDLGFDRRNMLRLHTGGKPWKGEVESFHFAPIFYDLPQEFRKETGAGITDALAMRADIFNRFTRLSVNVLTEEEWNAGKGGWRTEENTIRFMEIPYKAFDFFHIRMAEGQAPEPETEEGRLPVVMNEAAVRRFCPQGTAMRLWAGFVDGGWNSLMDMNLSSCVAGKQLDVQGIAAIRLSDFHEEEQPLMLVGAEDRHECRYHENDAVYVKYAPGRREDAEAAVRRVLRKFDVPEEQIHLTTLEDYIAGSYEEETYYANLLTALTAFSLVVTLSGVFSMLLYALRLRRRSMAIRRVMGAEFRDIFLPQLRTYLLFVLAGCVAAYFPASLLMRRWMEYFHYGEAPGVGLMTLIWAGMSAMVTLIVWWQVARCMREKPVEVLAPES